MGAKGFRPREPVHNSRCVLVLDFDEVLEMGLAEARDHIEAVALDDLPADGVDWGTRAFGKSDTEFLTQCGETAQKLGAGHDRGGGDRNVLFAPVHLHQTDLLALLKQGALDKRLVAELIGDDDIDIDLFEQVLDGARMTPGEHAVQVFEFGVEFVVLFRSNCHDGMWDRRLLDVVGELERPRIGELLGVGDSPITQGNTLLEIAGNGRDHEWTEEVAFAGLIGSGAAPHFLRRRLFIQRERDGVLRFTDRTRQRPPLGSCQRADRNPLT